MRFEPTFRCSRWKDCSLRVQFGGRRCFFMNRFCEHLMVDFEPAGREMEVVARPRMWGSSLGVTIPKRTVDRLGIKPGDELRLLVRKVRALASMPVSSGDD